jgi:hypothetical protein
VCLPCVALAALFFVCTRRWLPRIRSPTLSLPTNCRPLGRVCACVYVCTCVRVCLCACVCLCVCLQIYNTTTGRIAYSLREGAGESLPITAVKFRPASSSSKTKNVLLAVGAWRWVWGNNML